MLMGGAVREIQDVRTVATGSFVTRREFAREGLPREVVRELRPKASVELARYVRGAGNVPDTVDRVSGL